MPTHLQLSDVGLQGITHAIDLVLIDKVEQVLGLLALRSEDRVYSRIPQHAHCVFQLVIRRIEGQQESFELPLGGVVGPDHVAPDPQEQFCLVIDAPPEEGGLGA